MESRLDKKRDRENDRRRTRARSSNDSADAQGRKKTGAHAKGHGGYGFIPGTPSGPGKTFKHHTQQESHRDFSATFHNLSGLDDHSYNNHTMNTSSILYIDRLLLIGHTDSAQHRPSHLTGLVLD